MGARKGRKPGKLLGLSNRLDGGVMRWRTESRVEGRNRFERKVGISSVT